MAPPSRLRPHLNDLLQKNLELEHVVADLRHQLTQSAAKWADERKLLAMGCDTLMASFAKFRARLDTHPSDWSGSEGEGEQNLDSGGQSREVTEADHGVLGAQADQGSLTVEEGLREKCSMLAAELEVKEEELEWSRRKYEAAEEELRRTQRSLEAECEQLREALTSAKADTESNNGPPDRSPDDTSERLNASNSELENAAKKLEFADREIDRLKLLLRQWQKYGNDWKREAHLMRTRVSELESRGLGLDTQVRPAEGPTEQVSETEIREPERPTSPLENQTATDSEEPQRSISQDSVKRISDLEAMVALLRAQLSPEQLASIDSSHTETTPGPLNPTESPAPQGDPNPNQRVYLRIPASYRSIKKPPGNSNDGPPDDRGNGRMNNNDLHAPMTDDESQASLPQAPITISVPESALPQPGSGPSFNPGDYELCIHTCNPLPCRNEAQSFLWPRKQPSLTRHALSGKKHRHCTSSCPGHRLITMPTSEAVKQPRSTKCRPPTDAEIALATEEISKVPANQQLGEKGSGINGENDVEGSRMSEGIEEPEGGLVREEGADLERRAQSGDKSKVGHAPKRVRSRQADAGERGRVKKRRRRVGVVEKP